MNHGHYVPIIVYGSSFLPGRETLGVHVAIQCHQLTDPQKSITEVFGLLIFNGLFDNVLSQHLGGLDYTQEDITRTTWNKNCNNDRVAEWVWHDQKPV